MTGHLKVSIHPPKMFWVQTTLCIGNLAFALFGSLPWFSLACFAIVFREHLRDSHQFRKTREIAEDHVELICADFEGSTP